MTTHDPSTVISPEDASDQLCTAEAMMEGQAISTLERVAIDRFRLRIFMEMANSMKQKHLAEIMGVHAPVLNQLETDSGRPADLVAEFSLGRDA